MSQSTPVQQSSSLFTVRYHIGQDAFPIPRVVNLLQHLPHFGTQSVHNILILLQREVIHLVRIVPVIKQQALHELPAVAVYIERQRIMGRLESARCGK